MISRSDILKGEKLPEQFELNLGILLHRSNMFEQFVQNDMPHFKFKITSGYRTMLRHRQIYAGKGITDESKIPMKSNHLSARAIDILDLDGQLKVWVIKNLKLVEEIGIWFEDFNVTKNFVHCQTVPPLSSKRFFLP